MVTHQGLWLFYKQWPTSSTVCPALLAIIALQWGAQHAPLARLARTVLVLGVRRAQHVPLGHIVQQAPR